MATMLQLLVILAYSVEPLLVTIKILKFWKKSIGTNTYGLSNIIGSHLFIKWIKVG